MDPFTIASTVASIAGSLFGDDAKKKAAKQAQAEANRLVGIQHDDFNKQLSLTDILNGLLLSTDQAGYDTTNTDATNLRHEIGNQSVARFNEQATAVGDQTTANQASTENFFDAVKQAMLEHTGTYDAERTRQEGFQSSADAAAAAFLPQIGAGADATARGDAKARRLATSASVLAPPPVTSGGYTPPADPLIQAEFDKFSGRATDAANARADANATAGSFGDARAKEARTLGAFNDMIGSLRMKADASKALLPGELALSTQKIGDAGATFQGQTALSKLIADGKVDISDRYRTGVMGAMQDAGEGDINSESNYFAKLADSYKTGYGGQIDAVKNYDSGMTSLINSKISNLLGSQSSAGAGLSSLGALLATFSGGSASPASLLPRIPQLGGVSSVQPVPSIIPSFNFQAS